MANAPFFSSFLLLIFLVVAGFDDCIASQIGLGSRLVAKENRAWVSDNGTFAFGFTQLDDKRDQLQIAIWFAELPGDRTVVWSANRNSAVSNNAILELDTTGSLVLFDRDNTIWSSNTSNAGVQGADMSESGNFILYNADNRPVWQSFSYPSDTLLPNQPLSVSLELTTSKSPSHGGYYALKMLQQPTSLTLALTYNMPESYDDWPELYSNYSYWNAPDISNVTGDVVAVLDEAGSFGIVYGNSSDGAAYIYKNDDDNGGLTAPSRQSTRLSVLRRLSLETNGNLRLYRWDDDVNGSRQWVPEWAAVQKPCDIAGICGNGICSLDKSKTSASCTCLPGTAKVGPNNQCSDNSSLTKNCDSRHGNKTSQFRISMVQQTNYYYSGFSVIANYSDIQTVSKCGDACLADCECVASVYGFEDENPYCWVLRSLDFGGYEDPGSTLFVKVRPNDTASEGNRGRSGDSSDGSGSKKILVIPIVLSMSVLIGLLCLLLYYNVHRKRTLKRAMESSLILSGAPMSFSYRDLQIRTWNFSQLLGTGTHQTVTEDFFYPGWAFKEMTKGNPTKVADRRLEGAVVEEELMRALKVAFWCIQDEVFMRPTMGEVVRMLEGSVDHINMPPMPQTVLELIEEGLDHVYKAMKREFNHFSSFTINSHPSTHATCSYSTMSPR
ncbi:hypothetical protein FEM48_Zijuj03G0166300 [Ziziphus jujuba var. spinosa]|uniref:Bulb-type lectin domain-containing protein n=1 Tax=Ziziphus jujuba var. spinosa TaxID=714518 RepID=A0A978VRF4_ZIZJJ|nr:hypothetical protein FEM48_Zijuj03G0166300 [Ziziphus jujuba var. spinosa]